jgi:periplasmic protein TonB
MTRFMGIFIAILFYAALLLFGGIFFMSRDEQPKDKQEILTELFTKDEKAETKKVEKAKAKEPPPETRNEDKPPPDVVEEVKKMDAKIAELDQQPTGNHATELVDLAAISNALDGSMGGGDGGFSTGGLATLQPGGGWGGGASEDDVLTLSDLDQQPRVIFQVAPVLTGSMRTQVPATVRIIFIVDAGGKVTNPIVQQSSNPLFDEASLAAVKQWKFEPGKHNGKEVAFRMSVPITFPKRQ